MSVFFSVLLYSPSQSFFFCPLCENGCAWENLFWNKHKNEKKERKERKKRKEKIGRQDKRRKKERQNESKKDRMKTRTTEWEEERKKKNRKKRNTGMTERTLRMCASFKPLNLYKYDTHLHCNVLRTQLQYRTDVEENETQKAGKPEWKKENEEFEEIKLCESML